MIYIRGDINFKNPKMTTLKLARVPTGIEGFDDLIEGGLPEQSITLITGTPGTAKTIFGLEFIANGARKYGEKGVFITIEERPESLCRQFQRFGYDLESLVESKKIKIIYIDTDSHRGSDPYDQLTNPEFVAELKAFAPKRIVVDSISLVISLSSPPSGTRRALGDIANIFRELDATTLFMHERKTSALGELEYSLEEFLSDGIIHLQLHLKGNVLQRFLTVIKMRETKHSTGVYSFIIDTKGLKVFDLRKI